MTKIYKIFKKEKFQTPDHICLEIIDTSNNQSGKYLKSSAALIIHSFLIKLQDTCNLIGEIKNFEEKTVSLILSRTWLCMQQVRYLQKKDDVLTRLFSEISTNQDILKPQILNEIYENYELCIDIINVLEMCANQLVQLLLNIEKALDSNNLMNNMQYNLFCKECQTIHNKLLYIINNSSLINRDIINNQHKIKTKKITDVQIIMDDIRELLAKQNMLLKLEEAYQNELKVLNMIDDTYVNIKFKTEIV